MINPSFELPALADGGHSGTSTGTPNQGGGTGGSTNPLPSGWTFFGNDRAGHWNPNAASLVNWTDPIPDGEQFLFIDGDGVSSTQGGYFQTLTDTLQPGTYTLRADVAYRNSGSEIFTGYMLQLEAGGNLLAQDTDTISGAPVRGEWEERSLVFQAGPNHPLLGQPLGIRLTVPDLATGGSGSGLVNFDNLALDFEAALTPEPGTFVLLGVAAVGLFSIHFWGRRHSRDSVTLAGIGRDRQRAQS